MKNEFFVVGNEVFIKLNVYTSKIFWTVIDLADLDLVGSYNGLWRAKLNNRTYYALIDIGNEQVCLHRILFDNIPSHLEVDHKNREGLDNRRKNLRLVTHQENALNKKLMTNNTSGIAGVHFNKRERLWQAYISINGRRIHLGYFYNKEKAITARIDAEDGYLP